MYTFEKTLFNALLPMFERALAVAANDARQAQEAGTDAQAAVAPTPAADPLLSKAA